MKGRRVFLTAAALLILLAATPAMVAGARGGGAGGGGGEFAAAYGTISDIDYEDEWFVIDVDTSTGLGVDPLTVTVTEATRIKLLTECADAVPLVFGDLAVDDWVRVVGTMVGDILIAERITVDPLKDPSH